MFTQKLNLYLSTFLLGSLVFFGGGVNTFAQNKKDKKLQRNFSTSQKSKKALQNIDRLDPQKPTKRDLKLDKTSNHKDDLVSINSETSDIEITNKKGKLKFKAPSNINAQSYEVIDNKIIYSGDKVQSTIELVDGGVRQVINIESNDAPNFYDFPINIEDGQKTSLNDDGSVSVKNKDGELITYIVKPWARDSENKELKTWYEITSTGVRQVIDFSGAVFPVVADPIWCGESYFKLQWENRPSEGGLTLRVSPTWCGRQIGVNYYEAWETFKGVAWSADWKPEFDWYNKASENNTNTYWSMFKQYHCHTIYAPWKETWNLEPKRPNYTWRTFFNPRWIDGKPIPCNPE